jgi:acyl-coenzyme A synthetase/AMP-(fatty) acid ligase/3-hydroxymyristoyl/3-hydroxydecanoyl-(acyl carrier protein) dehydratase
MLAAHARSIVVVDQVALAQAHRKAGTSCLLLGPSAPGTPPPDAALAWDPDLERTAVVLHTSGSTGKPEPQPKSLRQLCAGARVLGAWLTANVPGGLAAVKRIVCGVPPQHMFGFEASVMLSLVHGIAVRAGRPLLPADVRDALSAQAPSAWVATPLNLLGLVRAEMAPASCAAVIASTMPLSAALARQTEALVRAPVLEIYGSTETGVLAMRRTAAETTWHPVAGVRVESAQESVRAWGEHFASPRVLSDSLEIAADGSFVLLGRQADLIKIAGRRMSLAGLNLMLQDLPGVEDAVFYLPATGEPTERLCLICSGPTIDRRVVLAWLRERLDPAFVPRTLIQVDRLPRSDNGKLPRAALDRVFAQWQDSRALKLDQRAQPAVVSKRFELVVPHDHAALDGHFPGRPVVPGALLLAQMLAELRALAQRPVARLPHVKFAAPLAPGERAQVAIEIEQHRVRFRVEVERGGASVLVASGSALLADAPGSA